MGKFGSFTGYFYGIVAGGFVLRGFPGRVAKKLCKGSGLLHSVPCKPP